METNRVTPFCPIHSNIHQLKKSTLNSIINKQKIRKLIFTVGDLQIYFRIDLYLFITFFYLSEFTSTSRKIQQTSTKTRMALHHLKSQKSQPILVNIIL